MLRAYMPNYPDPIRVIGVKREMEVLGAPQIRAYWDDEEWAWMALEGSHRLAAAQDLGIIPMFLAVAKTDTLTDHDLVDRDGEPLSEMVTVCEALSVLYGEGRQRNFAEFED